MDPLASFIKLSKYFGDQIEFIQGAGGNSSFKQDDHNMVIKASGTSLKNISLGRGYVSLNYTRVKDFLSSHQGPLPPQNLMDDKLNCIVDQSMSSHEQKQKLKASIETGMHTILKKYVIHTHPIYVNVLLCMEDGNQIIQDLFSNIKHEIIDYFPPGFYLAKAIQKALAKYESLSAVPSVIFLKNHGLIVHDDEISKVKEITCYVNTRVADYLKAKEVYVKFSQPKKDQDFLKFIGTSESNLFPDTVVFKKFLHQDLIDVPLTKQESIVETFSVAKYIVDIILKMGKKITRLNSEEAQYILNLSREKHRQKIIED